MKIAAMRESLSGLLMLVLAACNSASGRLSSDRALASSGPTPRATAPYPPAKWRMASQAELEQAVFWLSHIVIRHRDIGDLGVPFAPPNWRSSAALPTRTRSTALALATQIAEDLQRDPSRFQETARRISEDEATRAQGGSLGGISAYQLLWWDQVLDALAVIGPGEVSAPVETKYGFHILQRHPPPLPDTVSGRRIVIGYNDAQWLHDVVARGPVPERSRSEAFAQATDLFEQLRSRKVDFAALVDRYSEHRDASKGGFIGQWSTREVTPVPREVEILASLEIGQVAAPIDSLMGVEILARIPNRPRKQFAMNAVTFAFDPAAPREAPSSRASILQLARSQARHLAKEPASFASLQRQYCCVGELSWTEGGEFAELEPVLDGLEFGGIASEPVESLRQFVIPQRLNASSLPRHDVHFEMPSPEHADPGLVIGRLAPTAARRLLKTIAREAVRVIPLETELRARVLAFHDDPWGQSLDQAPVEERSRAFLTFRTALEGELGRIKFSDYESILNRYCDAVAMERGML
jgi:hypothetical protein